MKKVALLFLLFRVLPMFTMESNDMQENLSKYEYTLGADFLMKLYAALRWDLSDASIAKLNKIQKKRENSLINDEKNNVHEQLIKKLDAKTLATFDNAQILPKHIVKKIFKYAFPLSDNYADTLDDILVLPSVDLVFDHDLKYIEFDASGKYLLLGGDQYLNIKPLERDKKGYLEAGYRQRTYDGSIRSISCDKKGKHCAIGLDNSEGTKRTMLLYDQQFIVEPEKKEIKKICTYEHREFNGKAELNPSGTTVALGYKRKKGGFGRTFIMDTPDITSDEIYKKASYKKKNKKGIIEFNNSGNQYALVKGNVVVCDAKSNSKIIKYSIKNSITKCAFSADDQYLFIATVDNTQDFNFSWLRKNTDHSKITMYDVKNKRSTPIECLSGMHMWHTDALIRGNEIRNFAVDPLGNYLVVTVQEDGEHQRLELYKIPDKDPTKKWEYLTELYRYKSRCINRMRFNASGDTLAWILSDNKKTVRLWDFSKQRTLDALCEKKDELLDKTKLSPLKRAVIAQLLEKNA